MAVLATGGLLASAATAWMTTNPLFGIALGVVAFCLIGAGVGAAGTSLLVLLAQRTDDNRRATAATIAWIMMIAGFIVTTGVGRPYARSIFSAATRCGIRICIGRGDGPDDTGRLGH